MGEHIASFQLARALPRCTGAWFDISGFCTVQIRLLYLIPLRTAVSKKLASAAEQSATWDIITGHKVTTTKKIQPCSSTVFPNRHVLLAHWRSESLKNHFWSQAQLVLYSSFTRLLPFFHDTIFLVAENIGRGKRYWNMVQYKCIIMSFDSAPKELLAANAGDFIYLARNA